MKLSELRGASDIQIERDGAFESLGFLGHSRPGLLVFLDSPAHLRALEENRDVTAVIAAPGIAAQVPEGLGLAISTQPATDFYRLHNHLADNTAFYPTNEHRIAPSARISDLAIIAAEGVIIGSDVVIEAGAVIQRNVRLDDGVIIRSGAIIGGEGFQFHRTGEHVLGVRHAGGVWLHRGVEIQQNACVDRALFGGLTEIGEHTKIDNLVNIAHEVRIGRRVFIGAGAIISGSVDIGDDVWIGPQSCLSNALRVGDRGRVSLGAVVVKDVDPGQTVSGNFAIDHAKFMAALKSIA